MRCPFLKEVSVKYCGLCRVKMIPLNRAGLATEQCSGADYLKCAMARENHDGMLPQDRCPHLCIGDVHYCSLSPMPKLIPCNKTAFSRCTDEGHKYCQLYLSMADPRGDDEDDAVSPGAAPTRLGNRCGGPDTLPDRAAAEGEIPLPSTLAYTPNHMWLDRSDERTCHVGVDAFFGSVLGRVDDVSFPFRRNENRPSVRIRAGGVDFDLAFPNLFHVTEINTHLVVDPSELLRDPYGRGWVFEGITTPPAGGESSHPLEEGLVRGTAARRWMQGETERLARFVHDRIGERGSETDVMMQDGGQPCGHLADALGRGELVRLHSEFFSLRGRGAVEA